MWDHPVTPGVGAGYLRSPIKASLASGGHALVAVTQCGLPSTLGRGQAPVQQPNAIGMVVRVIEIHPRQAKGTQRHKSY